MVRPLVIGETAEHAPNSRANPSRLTLTGFPTGSHRHGTRCVARFVSFELAAALELLDDETLTTTPHEDLSEVVTSVARHAPAHLQALFARLPDDVNRCDLVPPARGINNCEAA